MVSAQPVTGAGNYTQREKYVSGDPEIMSTQERIPLGDNSDYMETDNATQMVGAGIAHNIDEALSQRMGVSVGVTDHTRAL